MNAGCSDVSTLHMWRSDGFDGEAFSNFSQQNMSIKGLSVAIRIIHLHKVNFMMFFLFHFEIC